MPFQNEGSPDVPDMPDAGTNIPAAPASTIPTLTAPIVGAFAGGAASLTIKAGDYGEWIKIQVSDTNGPVDLSAATLTLTLRGLYDATALFANGAGLTAGLNGGVHNEVGYQLAAGDTDKASDYNLEILMVWGNGRARTSNSLRLSILADL